MNWSVQLTIAITGFTVAFLHAAIPTHWLPFVLTGRVQRWSRAKTLLITAFCASGHVFITALLGFLVVWLGYALSDHIGVWFPRIAGGALLVFGLYFLWRQLTGRGHSHSHGHRHHDHHEAPSDLPAMALPSAGALAKDGDHGHDDHVESADNGEFHAELKPAGPATSDRAAIVSLLVLLTFSPCETFIPVYVSGIRYGWRGFALLTGVLSVGTVLGMVVFTWLTLVGFEKLKSRWLEHHESGILGSLLCALGLFVMFFEK